MAELLIWTSPRDMVVGAPDPDGAGAVRATLEAAGLRWWPVHIYGEQRAAATSLDIGVDADDCLRALLAAGYTFAWHPSQAPDNRSPLRFAFDVASAAE